MVRNIPPSQQKPTRSGIGLLLVGGGWLLLALAAVLLFTQTNGSRLPALLGAVGAVCVAIGTFLLSRSEVFLLFFGFVATACWGFGPSLAADARQAAAQSRPVTCEVTAVQLGAPLNESGEQNTDPDTDINNRYTMRCPVGTFTVDGGSRLEPEGARIKMVYVPGEAPRWPGVAGSNLTVGLAVTSVGGLLALVLPLVGWLVGRHRVRAEQRRRQAAAQRFSPAPPPSSPYQQW
jgi:hypothetical protein